MSELKKMTYMQLSGLLYPLGLEVNLHGRIFYKEGDRLNINNLPVSIEDIGIELVPEKPPVTQENLCKFYLKFKKWPLGTVEGCSVNKNHKILNVNINESYVADCLGTPTQYYGLHEHGNTKFYKCEITDKRWSEIAEGI